MEALNLQPTIATVLLQINSNIFTIMQAIYLDVQEAKVCFGRGGRGDRIPSYEKSIGTTEL